MSKVATHTRRVGGKTVKVRSHNRRQLQPRRAGRNAWTVMRGTGVVLATVGILAIGGAALARRFAK